MDLINNNFEKEINKEKSNKKVLKWIIRGVLFGLYIGLILIIYNKFVNSHKFIPTISAVLFMTLGCVKSYQGVKRKDIDARMKGRTYMMLSMILLFIDFLFSSFLF